MVAGSRTMISRVTHRSGVACAALTAMLFSYIPVPAVAWDNVNLRASASFRMDDNVFRLPDGVNAVTPDGSLTRSDLIRTLSAGITAEIPVSRQKFLFSYDINQSHYSNFSNLDFEGSDARALWKWEFGRLATGTAGISQTKSLADFSTSLGREPNTLTVTRQFVNGSYPFHANWQANWGLSRTEARNSDPFNRVSDNDAGSVNGELRYVSGQGNYVGIQWTRSAADYLYPVVVGATISDNSYKQDSVGLLAGYNIGGSTSLQTSLSRARRDPAQTGRSATTATTGTASLNWQPTGKTTLAIIAARDFSPPENITVSGSVANSLSLVATWRATAKISARANAGWLNRDYLFVPGAGTTQRRDTTTTQGVSVSYAALDQLSITLAASRESRDSDLPSAVYNTRGASLVVDLSF